MKLGIISILLWLAALPLMAQSGAIQGHSFLGGTVATTQGLKSSNFLDGIVPHATITVYLTGTQTLATITNGQGNANPFTSNDAGSLNPGGYLFFASISQGYDVVASGGIAPNTYPAPVTLCTDCYPSSQFTVESGVTSAQGVAPIAVDNDSTSPHTGAITISCPECGGANFSYQYTPAASGQYVLVFPTTCVALGGSACFASTTGAGGAVGNNGFSNTGITWSNPVLPSFVTQPNVTQVYAFAISYSNMTNAETASFSPSASSGTSFACGDNPHCFLPPGAGTAYGITQVNIPQTTGTPPIVADLGAGITQCCNASGGVSIIAIGFEVHYTGAAPPTSNAIQVVPPLYYNSPAQTLSLSSPINQAQDFGTVNAYQAVVPLLSQGPVAGDQAVLIAGASNTSNTPTFEVTNGVYNSAYTIINEDGSPLLIGEIVANVPVPLLFDGSHWQIVGGGGVTAVNGAPGPLLMNFSTGAGSCTPVVGGGTTCTFTGTSTGGGSVTNFVASTGSWPTWLAPSVATSTTTPTLSVTVPSQTANQFLASPNGSSGTLAVRAIVAADIPTLNQSTTGNAATATAISTNGSTGQAWGMTTGSTQGWLTISANPSFSALTGGTNTTAAMLVGTGASLAASGTGIIAATSVPAAGVASGALANGMTGTTQSPGDNTTKLATDAFVLANSAGSGTVSNCASVGALAYYAATGTTVHCDSAITSDGVGDLSAKSLAATGGTGIATTLVMPYSGTAPSVGTGSESVFAPNSSGQGTLSNAGAAFDIITLNTTAQTLTNKSISAGEINSGNLALAQMPLSGLTCSEVWSGSGTSSALQSGDDAISNNTCYNDSGSTRTITAVKCRSSAGSNTTTVNPTFGSAGTGTTILSGALTCGSSYAYSSSGTVSNASWTTGAGIDPGMATSSLTGSSIAVIVEYHY